MVKVFDNLITVPPLSPPRYWDVVEGILLDHLRRRHQTKILAAQRFLDHAYFNYKIRFGSITHDTWQRYVKCRGFIDRNKSDQYFCIENISDRN
jgi:hypothetical protein